MTRVAEWIARRGGTSRCALVAVVAGLMVTAVAPVPPSLAWCSLALAALGLTAGLAGRRRGVAVWGVLIAALCAGLLVGSLRVSTLTRSTLGQFVGERCIVDAVVGSQMVGTAWGTRCLLVVERVAIDHGSSVGVPPESVRLEVSGVDPPVAGDTEAGTPPARGVPAGDGLRAVSEGARVRVAGRLVAPSDGADGGFDQRAVLRREGVAVILRASADDVVWIGSRGGVAGVFDRLRAAARRHLSLGLRPRESGWLRGVVLGEQDAVDPVTVAALRRSGTAHILSVGGLHLASLAAVVLLAVRVLRGPRLVGYGLGGAAAWLFVPLVGASPPVMRAAVVLAFVLAAEASGRGRDRWQIYAAAAALTLALNPFSLFSLSFQLSFVAAAGLMLLTRPIQRRLGFLPAALAAGVATSAAATLATAPLSLLAFDQVAVMGVAANLLVVPVCPAVMAASLTSIVAGFLWHPLSVVLNVVSASCMAWVAWVAQIAARGPVLSGTGVAPALAAMAGGALAMAGVRWWKRRRRPHDGGPERVGPARPLALAALVVGVIAGVLAAHAVGRLGDMAVAARGGRGWPAQTEVRVLDVGEGSATLIRTADKHAVLVDAGPSGAGLEEQLRGLGVTALDLVVVTHPHADHYGGLAELSSGVRISTIADHVHPSGKANEYGRVVAEMARQGARHLLLADGQQLQVGGTELRVRAPPRALEGAALGDVGARDGGSGEADGATLNAASIVVEVRAGSLAILLPGDAEAEVLRGYGPPMVDVLVVPHHGSRGAVTSELLEELAVRLAIVPVGPNSFGHPARETLSTLEAAGVRVLRTDRAGWVAVATDDGRVDWQRADGGASDVPVAGER